VKNNSSNIIVFYLIIFQFFVLGDSFPDIGRAIRIILAFILVLDFFINKEKFSYLILVFTILFLFSILSYQESVFIEISSFLFLLIIFLLKENTSVFINREDLKIIFSICLFSLYFQLFSYYLIYEEFSFFRGDRNHSGIITLFFSILLYRFKMKRILILTIPIFLLLLSRNLIFSFLLFFILMNFNVFYKYKFISLSLILISLISLPLIVNFVFNNYFLDVDIGSSNDISRILSLKDGSNILRFKITGEQLENIFINYNDFLFRSESINDITRDVFKSEMPHSSIVEGFYRLGIIRFAVLIFVMIFLIRDKFMFSFFTSIFFAGAIIHNVLLINLSFLYFLINKLKIK
tara:strand:- start:1110 stop:2156 length:1047 start_codon:yes stop_codon:yes gene_type:complete